MKIFNRLRSAAVMASCLFGLMMPSAHADALDDCIKILQSDTYTIKYENVAPPRRSAMHEKIIMTGGNDFIDTNNPYTLYQNKSGIVTVKGAEHYIETNSRMRMPNISMTSVFTGLLGKRENEIREREYASCRLTKGDELFLFTRVKDKEEVNYISSLGKKGKVEAIKLPVNVGISSAERFGDFETTRLLSALLPDDTKPAGTKIYQRVNSGTLADGRQYFDFKAINPAENVFFDAIRYYFKDNRLVKIEAGQYFKDKFGKIDGVRTIINIHEFSGAADENLLKLPQGLEDVTKRSNAKKGAETK